MPVESSCWPFLLLVQVVPACFMCQAPAHQIWQQGSADATVPCLSALLQERRVTGDALAT